MSAIVAKLTAILAFITGSMKLIELVSPYVVSFLKNPRVGHIAACLSEKESQAFT